MKFFINSISNVIMRMLELLTPFYLIRDLYCNNVFHRHKWVYSVENRKVDFITARSTDVMYLHNIRYCTKCSLKQKRLRSFRDNEWLYDNEYTVQEKRDIALRKLNIE